MKEDSNEIFPIPNWEGQYGITKSGQVWSFLSQCWLTPTNGSHGYRVVSLRGKAYRIMHLMAHAFLGNRKGFDIDHIDRDRQNDALNNLRLVSRTENIQNSKLFKNNTSNRKGVCWYPATSKWRARISIGRKQIALGHFTDLDEAARAYDRAAIGLFGEQACTNESLGLIPPDPLKGFTI